MGDVFNDPRSRMTLDPHSAYFTALPAAAMTASMGLSNVGIITVDEVAFYVRQMVRAAGLATRAVVRR